MTLMSATVGAVVGHVITCYPTMYRSVTTSSLVSRPASSSQTRLPVTTSSIDIMSSSRTRLHVTSRGSSNTLRHKVYIGGLGEGADPEEIEKVFTSFGRLRVPTWVAKHPAGFAFAEFERAEDAQDAVNCLDGTLVTTTVVCYYLLACVTDIFGRHEIHLIILELLPIVVILQEEYYTLTIMLNNQWIEFIEGN